MFLTGHFHCTQNLHARPRNEIASYAKHSVHARLGLYLSEDDSKKAAERSRQEKEKTIVFRRV
jgi:hypothetical protein